MASNNLLVATTQTDLKVTGTDQARVYGAGTVVSNEAPSAVLTPVLDLLQTQQQVTRDYQLAALEASREQQARALEYSRAALDQHAQAAAAQTGLAAQAQAALAAQRSRETGALEALLESPIFVAGVVVLGLAIAWRGAR